MKVHVLFALVAVIFPKAFGQEHVPMFVIGIKADIDSEVAPTECSPDENAFIAGKIASNMEKFARMFFNDDSISITEEDLTMVDYFPLDPLAVEDFNTYEMTKFDQAPEADEVLVKSTGVRGLSAKDRTMKDNDASTTAEEHRGLASTVIWKGPGKSWITRSGAFSFAGGSFGICRFCMSDNVDKRRGRNVRSLVDDTNAGQKGWLVSGLETLMTYGLTYNLSFEYHDWLVQNSLEHGCLGDGRNLTVVFELWE